METGSLIPLGKRPLLWSFSLGSQKRERTAQEQKLKKLYTETSNYLSCGKETARRWRRHANARWERREMCTFPPPLSIYWENLSSSKGIKTRHSCTHSSKTFFPPFFSFFFFLVGEIYLFFDPTRRHRRQRKYRVDGVWLFCTTVFIIW